MKHALRLIHLLAITILLTTGCSKDRKTELQGNWLFPLAKGELSINSISSLENLEYNVDIPAFSLGVPENVSVSSPGLQISHVGPFALQIADWLRRVDIDTLEFNGSLRNFFPVPIGAGTKITMRNRRDTTAASIVGAMTIASDVAPGATFSFGINVYQKSLIDSVYFYLDEFRSPAYSNVVFSATPSHLNIRLGVVSASYVEIYSNKRFSSTDTLEFSAGSDESVSQTPLNDTATRGELKVFADNGMPTAISGQIYFLDNTRTRVLDSLLNGDLVIGAGQTNAAGTTTFTNSTRRSVAVSNKKLETIKAASFIVTRFIVSSEGLVQPYAGANRSATMRLQFTGDLNITVRF
jgi:hypothetical protein